MNGNSSGRRGVMYSYSPRITVSVLFFLLYLYISILII